MNNPVWEKRLDSGRHIEITWSGAQTTFPTGVLDGSTPRRTRYFFEIIIDGTYYFANRFLTSPDAEHVCDSTGTPILARPDLILDVCGERIAKAMSEADLSSLPNDLGYLDVALLLAADQAKKI